MKNMTCTKRMHLIDFSCVRSGMKNSTKRTEVLSLQKAKSVHAASKQQYTAAGREVQVPLGGIHEWRKPGQGGWYTDRWSKRVLRELCRFVVRKRKFSNTTKLFIYKLVLVPILTYGHESCVMANTVPSPRGRVTLPHNVWHFHTS